MDNNTFQGIVQFINSYKGLSRDCLKEMERFYPNISPNTLASILCTRYQKKMMMNHGKVKHNKKDVIKRYNAGITGNEEPGLIVRLARHYDVAPALIAKVILEEKIESLSKTNKESENLFTKNMIKEMFKDTTKIPDPDLAYEVFLAIVFDNMYGPIADCIKHCLGVEYEERLTRHVERLGLAYKGEHVLRARGYDKTPDVKLDTPFMTGGMVVNWVESKAVFGDQATHDQYAQDQYLSYWNRFGPGMVIYWFGCVESVFSTTEKRFIVRDKFPEDEDIILMNPCIVDVPKLNIT